ncbi:DUF262 domain-containing protein [Lentzea albidocapillata]|uniref:DUF262 domain-containing protein n=1 Tax=Lentzea albidocapillata TaxID=40571 RepID=A0A1W2FPL9_9PSEU|nr:DUF262 domain-containing protein [Lentzea albidocapillata]SMD23909.1 Protein of unknown function [Lentzea albidocapillata]
MQAHTHTPAIIFGHHIRYVVPLFQRPYVWTEDDQWQPLWEDIRTLTERLLDAPPTAYGAPPLPPHFLGAIVLDQQTTPSGFIATRHIIDGQQRLTTLQLLLDAAQWVVEQHGADMDAQALKTLVLNGANLAEHSDHVFKVWPTDRDQDSFRAVMDNATQLPPSLATSKIAQAHMFFAGQITEWADVTGDPDKVAQRLNALVRALRDHLKIVVIDLEPGDNAQVIFETLNHRGSPLLAADLIKNLIFQLAQAEGADVPHLYKTYWKPLDGDYWRQPVAQGRRYRPRIDLFLNHWLTMKLLREVAGDRVFADFRDHVFTHHPAIADLLAELAADAQVYQQMENLAPDSIEGVFHYRVIRALDSAVVSPFLLWILRWPADAMSAQQRTKAITALESWMVRRALTRATAKDLNRMILDLLRALDNDGPARAGDTVETVLATQHAESRHWPDDHALHRVLDTQPIYKILTRPRMRMLLEALEDSLRGPLGEGQTCPRNLTVEHVMPQAWREHWGADIDGDHNAGAQRDQLVHSLGNLTLVNGKLNPTLSNRPWTDEDTAARGLASGGKRDYLLRHSQLKLNATLVAQHHATWTEQDILDRASELVGRIATIWSRPVEAVRPQASSISAIADFVAHIGDDELNGAVAGAHTGKYRALWRWLRQQPSEDVSLSFAQVEQILDGPLPPSARNHLPHWYGYDGTALGRAIRDAGWKATHVNLIDERVTFVHIASQDN